MHNYSKLLVLALCAGVASCSEAPGSAAPGGGTIDVAPDVPSDAADSAGTDAAADAEPGTDTGGEPLPVAPPVVLEPFDAGPWMVAILPPGTDHFEEGAGHWWDGDAAPGADRVDWPGLFEFMRERTLDPYELTFRFRSPSPWVSPTHSFVTIRSKETPAEDAVVESAVAGDEVALTTENVRSMVLDGAALRGRGIARAVVDGDAMDVPDGPLPVGPQSGKRPGAHGPFNEVLERPWCVVWSDDGPEPYRRYAAWLIAYWTVIGNGSACGMPLSALTEVRRAGRNVVYLGVPRGEVPLPAKVPFGWSDDAIEVAGQGWGDVAGVVVFPEADGLGAAMIATAGDEGLLFRLMTFTSRFVVPDYLVFGDGGVRTTGFFDAEWGYEPAFASP
jgi:hypothetical protein